MTGDRVAAQVDKCWEALALYLACLRAGLVFLPLNTGYQRSELAYFFADATPRVIVCRPDAAESAATLARGARVLTLAAGSGTLLEDAAGLDETFEPVFREPNDLAAILYTSGTTGRPKGAMLSHRNLGSNALALVDCWGFTRGDVLLHALPIYHVHGLFVACHCALLSGSHMLWLAKFDPQAVRRAPAARHGHDGRAHVLHAAARRARARCRRLRVDAALHHRGSAPLLPETLDAVPATHRVHHPRALRDVRDRHARRPTRSTASASGRHGRAVRCRASQCASSDDEARPARAARSATSRSRGRTCSRGYWRLPEKIARGVHRRRLLPHGRRGRDPRQRLPPTRRPRQGPHHHRRPQRLPEGNRGDDRRAAGSRRIRGDRRAAIPTSAKR